MISSKVRMYQASGTKTSSTVLDIENDKKKRRKKKKKYMDKLTNLCIYKLFLF